MPAATASAPAEVAVEDRHLGALAGEGQGRRGADTRRAAGDQDHVAGQASVRPPPELGLFEGPILDVENIGLADAPITPDGLGVGDDIDVGRRQVGGNVGVRRRLSEPEQAEAGDQDNPRHGVQLAERSGVATAVAGEIGAVGGLVVFDRRLRPIGEGIQLAGNGRRHDQGPGLDADGVVGGRRSAAGVVIHLGAVDEGADAAARTEGENGVAEASLMCVQGDRRQAAQDGRHRGHRGDPPGHAAGGEDPLAALGEARLGQGNELDHARVGCLGVIAEGDDAVLQEDQAFEIRVGAGDRVRLLGQGEARTHVGHQADAPAEDAGAHRGAVGLVGKRQDGVGMGMIDEPVGQEGVQQGLERGSGCCAVHAGGTQCVDHFGVVEAIEAHQPAQGFEPERRQVGGLDTRHVAARALDAEHVDRRA